MIYVNKKRNESNIFDNFNEGEYRNIPTKRFSFYLSCEVMFAFTNWQDLVFL